ncbi:MAG: ABC transporter substrate-binding protein [Alphaproteobacteria bacterium]|nr:ABC transporter substrate-binding protein [Alphaproteobacteria bacterium]MCW5740310.1 ABC transporter substrate-binding protein [Alphaproteobacteria bacterium]
MRLIIILTLLAVAVSPARAEGEEPAHGLNATGGPLRYGPDFEAFAYANPLAPQGGTLRQSMMGTFDTLNTYVIRGRPVVAVHTNVHASLLKPSQDEPLTGYAWLAKSVRMGAGERWVEFALREDATFHDGQPITTEDLLFTAEALRQHGRPFYRSVLARVRLEALGSHRLRVHLPSFRPRQLALEYASLPVLPRHWWQGRAFGSTTLEPPLGSGPYRVATVEAGRRIVLERVRMTWSDDLPAMRGAYNFDRHEIVWIRDRTAQFEAFLAGDVDIYADANPRHWATAYDVEPVRDGRIRRLAQRNWFGTGMSGFMFNLRSPLFADRRVREALSLMYDFEWANRVLFHGGYERSYSYFQNTKLAAGGLPSEPERAALASLPPQIAALMPRGEAAMPPVSDGSGHDRRHLERAFALLQAAGWRLVDGRLRHQASGRAFDFAVMAQTQSQALQLGHWFRALRRLGIEGRLEVVDSSVYNERLRQRRFDMTQRFTIPSQWPGSEQQVAWHSTGGPNGSGDNLLGLNDPLVDALVDRLAGAQDYESIAIWGRLLDRALRAHVLGVPGHQEAARKLAIWDKFAWPDRAPGLGYGLEYWWRRD